jgi:hypothetical protein
LLICGSILGQSAYSPFRADKQKGELPANAKPSFSTSASDRTVGPKYWIEPVGDVMNSNGIDLTGATTGQSQDTYLQVLYMDSTTQISSAGGGTRTVSDILSGTILDPYSPSLDPTGGFNALLQPTESYSIDSVALYGSYVKVNPAATDTLYVWLVWGDTANTNVFVKRTTTSIWVAPIETWRPYIIGAKVTGSNAAVGNRIKAAAPASNRRLIKHVLTADDEAQGPGYSKLIEIEIPGVANIPAGNIASCFFTFVPENGTHVTGDVSYAFDGAPDLQTANGFGTLIWNQTSPVVAAVTDYEPQQVDALGYNMGTSYYMEQRHALYPATYNNSLWGDLVTAPLVYYSVYANDFVGVNQLNKNEFTLGQNVPNPLTNQTKISYELKKNADNVSLAIFDVAGVKVFEKTSSNVSSGSYSVEVKDVDFSSGIYFYSLTVDGNKAVKKMVVTK